MTGLSKKITPKPFLPDRFRPGKPLPKGIVGSKIVKFGAAPQSAEIEGGGLVIEYVPAGKKKSVVAVFAFTELGMWLV